MNQSILMAESEFHARVDTLLAAVEAALERAAVAVDSEINNGILTLECEDASKIIVNRQTPNREIWVAARSGGFHFRFDGALWRDTRSQESLQTLLGRVISAQSGSVIAITF